MSGGSWDYAYRGVEDVARKLTYERNENRAELGKALLVFAEALHAIEWCDSCDWSSEQEDEAVKKALAMLSGRHASKRDQLVNEKQRLEARLVAIDVELEVEP